MGLAGLKFYALNPTQPAIKKIFVTQPNLPSPKNWPNPMSWVSFGWLTGWLHTLIHNPSFMKINFWKTLPMRKYFVHYYLSQRERKDRLFRKARILCASSLCWRSFYLEKQISVSSKVSQIVWGVKFVLRRLCQTKNLICIIHSHAFGLWVFNYFTDFFWHVQYLFIVFMYYIIFLLLLSIRSIYCSILLNLVEIYPTICSLFGWFFIFKKKIIIIIIYPLKRKKREKKKNQ